MRKLLYFALIASLLTACGGGGGNNTEKATAIADTVAITEIIKPTINVYIENSASMDGYVKGGSTDFKQILFNYLVDIQGQKVTDSLNLFFINSKTIPLGSNIDDDFYKKLNPESFKNLTKKYEGNRGETDIAQVLGMVLKATNKNDISIMVTDGIISPGKRENAAQWLDKQGALIRKITYELLDTNDNVAVIVYQLSSQFDGLYFDKEDKPIPYKGARPFYIWIIGDAKYLTNLRHGVPESKFQGDGVQNVFLISTGNQQVKYAINPSIGKFTKSKKDTRTTIENLKKDSRTGKVKFAVNVDFSNMLLNEKYLLDNDNYENSSKYELEIKPSAVKNQGYTHILNFSSDKVYKGTVSIKLKVKRPDWVDEVNDDDGSTAVAGKTYGIKYQINGVFNAFTFDDRDKYYTEIKININ